MFWESAAIISARLLAFFPISGHTASSSDIASSVVGR